MDGDARNRLREAIGRDIEETRLKIAALEERIRPVAPDNAIGRLSRMEAMNDRGVSEATLGLVRTRMARLKRAVIRIDGPDFGLCVECGEPIPLRRLQLMPEVTLCVGCAEELE